MAGAVKRKQQRYSYADYLSWDDDKRYEIITVNFGNSLQNQSGLY